MWILNVGKFYRVHLLLIIPEKMMEVFFFLFFQIREYNSIDITAYKIHL